MKVYELMNILADMPSGANVLCSGSFTVNVPKEIDREVALRKISYWGIEIDKLTPEQEKYLGSWEV